MIQRALYSGFLNAQRHEVAGKSVLAILRQVFDAALKIEVAAEPAILREPLEVA